MSTTPIQGPNDHVAMLEILLDGGALCVAGVWDWDRGCRRLGLYAIYHKKTGFKVGPYYTSINRAHMDMKKVQKQVPMAFWDQPHEWVVRQTHVHDWIDKELGKPEDLVGGEWDTT